MPASIFRVWHLSGIFPDASGAGGRGLSQAIGSAGQIGLIQTGDHKLVEAVVLR